MYTKAERELAQLAAGRAGTFHRSEATARGLSDRQIQDRLAAGMWAQVLPRVYRSAGTPITPEMMRFAALQWAGKGTALAAMSAAMMWELDRVVEEKPEVVVPQKRSPRSDLVVVHRDPNLNEADITEINGLRCTTMARTISDLAARLDAEVLEMAIESARRTHGTEIAALRHGMRSGTGHPGSAKLREILDALDGSIACESVLEVKVARLLRAARMPEPVKQYRVRIFGRLYRLDFAWPRLRVALECDGRAFHEFQRDRTRWRHLGASGWKVLPVTWRDATQGWDAVLSELTAALASCTESAV